MTRIALLGSTGSIGRQTLDVIRAHPGQFEVVAMSARTSAESLRNQADEFGVKRLALMDKTAADKAGLPGGMEAVVELATLPEVDLVVVAVAGVIGLVPTLAAIREGKRIALASKEVLVSAGELVMPLVRERGVMLTPIDSEHSAVFQCVQGVRPDQIAKVILTASGGPFRGWTREQLQNVTREQALNHPTWKMGGKITVDSATLMNKALEMIEARWLFNVPMDSVEVVVHPQSIVHSFVELTDGSVLAQLGWPDMRLPIQYALSYPERPASGLKPWRPHLTPNLTFEPPNEDVLPSLRLARQVMKQGGTAPCAFNAANEEAVAQFLNGKCGFLAMAEVVERVVNRHAVLPVTLEGLLDVDKWARAEVRRILDIPQA